MTGRMNPVNSIKKASSSSNMSCSVLSSKTARASSYFFFLFFLFCHSVFICGAGVSGLRGNSIVKALLLLLICLYSGIKSLQFMI